MIVKMAIVAVIGYLLGNFQTGVVISKALGKFDVRHRGSKSAGTTNVLRTMGWVPSLLTLLGDVLKGVLAALIGLWLGGIWGARLGGLCAILGHNWPALFRFKGGKGIATSLGLVLVLDPLIGVALVVCQVIVLKFTHTMSIASIASASLFSLLTVLFHWGDWAAIGFSLLITALALFSHRTNIHRLKHKSENKLDFKEIDRISHTDKSMKK
ncbi:MAG: glycerol-3-phosphate 1-O-acyltransferase PlsY [Clostridia bacterium]